MSACSAPESRPPAWCVRPLPERGHGGHLPSPHSVDDTWMPLHPFGPALSSAAGFQPGWARVGWNASGLEFDTVFVGDSPANRARSAGEAAVFAQEAKMTMRAVAYSASDFTEDGEGFETKFGRLGSAVLHRYDPPVVPVICSSYARGMEVTREELETLIAWSKGRALSRRRAK